MTEATVNEKALVARIEKGDRQAEQELIEELQLVPRVRAMVRSRLQASAEDIDDIVSEVLMAVITSLREGKVDQKKGGTSLYAWGIARNKIRDHYRPSNQKRRQMQLLDENTHAFQDRSVERREQNRLLVRALDKLDEKYRLALQLRYIEGHPVNDIAEKLSLTATQVYSRIHYGLELLRLEYEKLE